MAPTFWRRARARCWRELAASRTLISGLICYGVLRVIYAHIVGSHGLLTPSGGIDSGAAIFSIVMLVMRMAILVIVPFAVTYKLVRRLIGRLLDAWDERPKANGPR
jgi:hypothetical protein